MANSVARVTKKNWSLNESLLVNFLVVVVREEVRCFELIVDQGGLVQT